MTFLRDDRDGDRADSGFEFFVDDLAATKARLTAAGCRIEQEDPSVPRCYVRDPYGLVFNIAVQRG